VDLTAKYFGIDHNRCILCMRCVRTCDEIEGVHTLDVAYRGIRNQVVVDMPEKIRRVRDLHILRRVRCQLPDRRVLRQGGGLPGPARELPDGADDLHRMPARLRLKVFTKENRIVKRLGDSDSPVNRGHLCVKGRYETWAEPRERITQPLLRGKDGKLKPATWDNAIAAIRKAAKAAKKTERRCSSPAGDERNRADHQEIHRQN